MTLRHVVLNTLSFMTALTWMEVGKKVFFENMNGPDAMGKTGMKHAKTTSVLVFAGIVTGLAVLASLYFKRPLGGK